MASNYRYLISYRSIVTVVLGNQLVVDEFADDLAFELCK